MEVRLPLPREGRKRANRTTSVLVLVRGESLPSLIAALGNLGKRHTREGANGESQMPQRDRPATMSAAAFDGRDSMPSIRSSNTESTELLAAGRREARPA